MLLFRGADKECTNLLNQNALHLASFYGYSSLHQLIASHSQQDTSQFFLYHLPLLPILYLSILNLPFIIYLYLQPSTHHSSPSSTFHSSFSSILIPTPIHPSILTLNPSIFTQPSIIAAPVKEMPVYNDKSRSTLRKRSHGNLMTSKLKKLSLSSPYLHQSVTNLNSTDARYSIRSFESEGNSTGK